MSIGKVRIYDLSKELNLDNRDLLAICEQLGIAYKSHSSTISDADADRIREAAKTYQPHSASPRKVSKTSPPVKKAPAPQKTQQIVAVHTQPRSETPEAPKPQLQKPPARPQPPQAPTRPTPPAPVAPKPVEPVAAKPPAPPAKPEPTPPRPVPTLVPPPTRPTKKEEKVAATPPPRKELKEPPKKEKGAIAAAKPSSQDRIEIVQRAVPPAPAKPPEMAPKPALPELQPPPKPVRAPNPPKPVTETVEVLDDKSVSKVIKDRHRHKDFDEEESKRKSSRVVKLREEIIDEEEELELTSRLVGVHQVTVDVSQSLQRPPKPKVPRPARPVTPAAKTEKSSEKKQSRHRDRRPEEPAEAPPPDHITIAGPMSVQELATLVRRPEAEIIKTLFFKGIAATINQTLEVETIELVAKELGITVETAEHKVEATKVTEMLESSDLDHLQRRPPVVTIMGHVDHGKTTLLDAIRNAKVAQGEAGGITQHIGAYHVDVEHNGEKHQVVFLDTPGHEAFTAMRARGARVTDIAVLVVAADDGVQPQTIEAISHAKAAKVPIIVAINKIDKESAQPERIKQELTEYGLVPEEWGGDTIMVPVSALQQQNLDTLLEMILLVAEVEDLYANPNRPAKGTVIEAHLDRARGPVATLLVQNGTLRVGDILVAGACFGRVRAMIDDRGQRVEAATPSFAVEVLGLAEVPAAGDEFEVLSDEKAARALAEERAAAQRQSRLAQAAAARRVSLTSLSSQAREGELKELNLILKADVQGSVEAILTALNQLPQDQVQLRVLLAAPGEITETDVDLAAASSAVIIGFNTTLASGARQAAEQHNVDIREYNIIYKLLDDIQGAMEGMLEPELVEEELGQAEVRAIFPLSKGVVAGCYVLNGKLVRNCKVRVLRQQQVIHTGILSSLKRLKDDVREVAAGYECGVRLDDFQQWQEGDIIYAFQTVTKRRSLGSGSDRN
ncbi:translation initiation factor IF-2 [Thermosynechococcus vestitus]|uniref:Translation initiation factor IF-2 n=1 Tax=Thermosynechococcus vestitus (strain NIES-2133 / IAM M-273 / BP-1) TaxID=197221 RepID=IF2_THEVB|nr:translation initiation factor IF-2 [Thermosynechococcus vestitus]Q8DK04.1 RecName: Full=Translation initiation factor IF-2 [Thermosynechococcus vestitus BP-1]BAC08619.1 translation initiation factor IF-2 [Thermosynechococcus vestitus BP-1]